MNNNLVVQSNAPNVIEDSDNEILAKEIEKYKLPCLEERYKDALWRLVDRHFSPNLRYADYCTLYQENRELLDKKMLLVATQEMNYFGRLIKILLLTSLATFVFGCASFYFGSTVLWVSGGMTSLFTTSAIPLFDTQRVAAQDFLKQRKAFLDCTKDLETKNENK